MQSYSKETKMIEIESSERLLNLDDEVEDVNVIVYEDMLEAQTRGRPTN